MLTSAHWRAVAEALRHAGGKRSWSRKESLAIYPAQSIRAHDVIDIFADVMTLTRYKAWADKLFLAKVAADSAGRAQGTGSSIQAVSDA